MAARVPYAVPTSADDPLAAIYAEISELRGEVLNLNRALGNSPGALRAFMATSRFVRDDSTFPARWRELAILLTGHLLDVSYEVTHHVRAARKVGITESEIESIPTWRDSTVFDAAEQAILAYAEAMARDRSAPDDVFEALRSRLSNAWIVELTLILGWYQLCAVVLRGLRVEIED